MRLSRSAADARRAAEIGRFLDNEKRAACHEVDICVASPNSPRAVRLDGVVIAWIRVQVLEDPDDPMLPFYTVGFVHLTHAGYALVNLPWSPL